MADRLLEDLAANPPASLAAVVARATGDPTVAISDLRVQRLSDQGIRNPDGLLLFSGGGGDAREPRRWSVVGKMIDNEDAEGLPQDHLWYWKREVLAMQTGLLDDLPAGIAAPRCFGVDTYADRVWIWMEHVADESPRTWTTDEFTLAASASGSFGGAYLSGRPVPDHSWLARDHARGWVGKGGPAATLDNAFVQQLFTRRVLQRVMRLWDDRELVFDWLNRLPQTFAHGDYHRRNLMISRLPDGTRQVVAVDWAWCGPAPVGGDLGMLLGMSANLGDIDPGDLTTMEPVVYDAYLAGLRAAGWRGHSALVRLGYTAWLAMFAGVTAPGLTAFWTAGDRVAACERLFGPPEDAARRWATICEFALDRADEARALGERLLR